MATPSVNSVTIIGTLGRDPEVHVAKSGAQVCNMSIATHDRTKTKEGAWEERAEWHRIVAFGSTADACIQYLKKGQSAYVEGRLQTRSWEDKDGQKKFSTEIVANRVVFLGGGKPSAPPSSTPVNDTVSPLASDDELPF